MLNEFFLLTFSVFIFIFAVVITGFVRKYSLKNAIIDVPNERSSHSVPTPRGGGLSIAISLLAIIGILFFSGFIPMGIAMALGIGGLIIVVIGWIDDHRHISAIWRGLGYFFAAGWAVYCLGGLDKIRIGTDILPLGDIGILFAILWIAWLTNLYNFMDGTDGLAGSEALCIGLFAGYIFWGMDESGLTIICLTIVMSVSGFLYWNWPPAKIFMGDVGSCLLGYMFGVLSIIGEKEGTITFAIWLILLAVFIVDATLTLLMRIIKGERWYNAHHAHAYQRWIQLGSSHKQLVIGVLLINVIILWPMAYMAYVWAEYSYLVALASIIFIAVLWVSIQVHYHRVYS